MKVLPLLRSYEDWQHCITRDCGIPLQAAFIAMRLAAQDDLRGHGTLRFIQTWGEAHLARVQGWFQTALIETRTSGYP